MADRIRIWTVDENEGRESALPLEELTSTETEQRLEELLVTSPDLLAPGLSLIGRQVMTAGGPLDLLGINGAGRLVLFELKRGTLTRDAVAQILDYASDLRGRDPDEFAGLVEENSGKNGIVRIDDFSDWYRGEFPDVSDPPPTDLGLVLLGLGVDEAALRMVNYLVESGLDIQLVTFQAFRSGSQILLTRKAETVAPKSRSGDGSRSTKRENRRILEQLAESQGVGSLLVEVADFLENLIPGYRWPGKTAFTFSLQERTAEGRPSYRAYAAVYVDRKERGRVLFSLNDRAIHAAPLAVERVVSEVPEAQRTSDSWMPFMLPITVESWPGLRGSIQDLVDSVIEAWREDAKRQETDAESGDSDETSQAIDYPTAEIKESRGD